MVEFVKPKSTPFTEGSMEEAHITMFKYHITSEEPMQCFSNFTEHEKSPGKLFAQIAGPQLPSRLWLGPPSLHI